MFVHWKTGMMMRRRLRRRVLRRCRGIGGNAARTELLALWQDDDAWTREAAEYALILLEDPRARVEPLQLAPMLGQALVARATAATTHVYPVSLTISVDRAAGKINGTIVTDAPSEFCDSSSVRLRIAMPGHDTVAARLSHYGAEWQMKSGPFLSGKRVYAEVLAYHLPARPVECLGARTRAVTAP